MKLPNFEAYPIDELWAIHEQVGNLLAEKMTAERIKIEERLNQLRGDSIERRHYSRIPPKYRNPANPYQTWSGRGRTPMWIKRLRKEGTRALTIYESARQIERADLKRPCYGVGHARLADV
jgi:DNA-binding protein H-NS